MTTLRNIFTTLFIAHSFFAFGQTVNSDTTFLLKETKGGTYHSIFIDTNSASEFYDQISDFTFAEFDQKSYSSSLNYLKANKIVSAKKTIKWIPLKWIILKQYKDKFYTYKPSDFLSHFKISIIDSAFIDYTGEGPIANKIIDFVKVDDKTFKFRLTSINIEDRTLIIHIIDKKNGIAVFEDTSKGKNKFFYLMISADKIRKKPIIVNYCETEKQLEYHFDKPNYSKLLKNK